MPADRPTHQPDQQGAVESSRAQFRRNEDCLSTALIHGALLIGLMGGAVCRHDTSSNL